MLLYKVLKSHSEATSNQKLHTVYEKSCNTGSACTMLYVQKRILICS